LRIQVEERRGSFRHDMPEGTESVLPSYREQGCTQPLEHLKFFRRGNETDIGHPPRGNIDTMIARYGVSVVPAMLSTIDK
jgi:hypothetical protein